jgi:hypothetical protein
MTKYEILYWHDIPVQIRAGSRRDRASVELPPRFQEAVDKAAMAAGLTGTDGYLSGFGWRDAGERDGPPADIVKAVAAEIDFQYADIDWRVVANRIKSQNKIR